MRYSRHGVALVLAVLVTLVLGASPSSAHTGFESSDPADGATLTEPVTEIALVFGGQAEPTGDGFQILDPQGQLIQPTEAVTTDGLTWVLRFNDPLAGGVVGVRWMVKAPDAHPIDGSFSFTVEASMPPILEATESLPATPESVEATAISAAPATDLASFLDTSSDPTATPRRLGAAARAVVLLGTLGGVGALVFAAVVLRGDRRDVYHVLHWVRRAGLLAVLGALIELVAQIAVEGGGWMGVLTPSVIGTVVASSFGVAVALRIAGGIALTSGARTEITHAENARDPVLAIRELVGVGAGPTQRALPDEGQRLDNHPSAGSAEPYVHQGDQAWLPTTDSIGAVLGALALIVAHSFDGHAVTKGPRLPTAIVDVVHVAGGAVWAGGVFMLVAVLWRRHRQGRELRALQLAVRFSVVATLALVVVGVAGMVLAVVILDSPSELWTTEWGRTLVVKSALVALAAGAGGYNHKVLIPLLHRAPASPVLAQRFQRVITVEAIALVAVLFATAVLMGASS